MPTGRSSSAWSGEGKVLLLAPENTRGFSRVERDVDKIRALWQSGYDQTMGRMEEIRDFLRPGETAGR